MFGSANFTNILIGSFAVRAFQCAVVWQCGWKLGLPAGLLQFVVAPLSLTGSLIRLCTNISDCVFHYLLNLIAVLLVSAVPALPSTSLNFGMPFVVLFFAIDFLLNLFVYWRTSEAFGPRRLCMHILYGTFNTKTYFVVVLGCLHREEFNIAVVLLTGLLSYVAQEWSLGKRLLDAIRWPCFPVCFYRTDWRRSDKGRGGEHRVGHMPIVYQHAHKMHHYLHDSTPFDAHIYGSGMNEEFFWILAETLPCLLAPGVFFPYFLNPVTLWISWTNKGAHARTAEGVTVDTAGCFDEDLRALGRAWLAAVLPLGQTRDNFHADHHTLHRTNFGSSTGVLLDFYFGTAGPTTKGSAGMAYAVGPDPSDETRVLVTAQRAVGSNRAERCPTPAHGLCLDDEGPAPARLKALIRGRGLRLRPARQEVRGRRGGARCHGQFLASGRRAGGAEGVHEEARP
ncbi:unnamed protein product [Prorocentrum cordatum]|uniref:Fatty acid hydroxylase domain-containing protein n=1 Tax=Prorocentrum cordatum TaxID=2364126 RepID=A0ABN9TBC0_9DINO|nr:unnamed protein product [Polarella glacialis]